jgi:hypothetical protein
MYVCTLKLFVYENAILMSTTTCVSLFLSKLQLTTNVASVAMVSRVVHIISHLA